MIGLMELKADPRPAPRIRQAAALCRPHFHRLRRRLRAAGFGRGGRRRLDADVCLARGCADHRRRRRHVCAAAAGGRGAAALVGRPARFRGRLSSPTYSYRPTPWSPAACCRRSVALALGLIVTVTGALYFADRRMKTCDSYFRGFPALWNVVAFYLFVLKPAPWLGAVAIVVLAAATFAPIHFVHPVRVPRWRASIWRRLVLWALLALLRAGAKPRSAALGRPRRLRRLPSIS